MKIITHENDQSCDSEGDQNSIRAVRMSFRLGGLAVLFPV